MARKVEMLKKTVPADCVTAAIQAARPAGPRCRCALANQVCSAPPVVKNNDPAKNVTASAAAPTRSAYPGKDPTRKHADPTANDRAMTRWARILPDAARSPTAAR